MFKSPVIWMVLTIGLSFVSGVVLGPKLFTKSTTIKGAVSSSVKVGKKYPTVSPSRITDKVEVEKLKAEIAAKTEMLSNPTVSPSIYNLKPTENETEIFEPKIKLYKRKLTGGDSYAWMKEPPPPGSNEPIITYEMVQAQELRNKDAKLREILEKQTKGTIVIETPSGYFKFLSKDGIVKLYSPELQPLYTTQTGDYGPYGPFLFLDNLIETWELAAKGKYQKAIAESKGDLSLQETAKVNLSSDIQIIAVTNKMLRMRLDAIYENQFLTPKRKHEIAMELLEREYIPDIPIVMPTQPLGIK